MMRESISQSEIDALKPFGKCGFEGFCYYRSEGVCYYQYPCNSKGEITKDERGTDKAGNDSTNESSSESEDARVKETSP